MVSRSGNVICEVGLEEEDKNKEGREDERSCANMDDMWMMRSRTLALEPRCGVNTCAEVHEQKVSCEVSLPVTQHKIKNQVTCDFMFFSVPLITLPPG